MDSAVFCFGAFRLDPVKRELRHDGELVEVPPRVFVCLLYLIEHRERAVERAELIEAAWRRSNVSDTQLFQLILRARRVVGDDADRQQSIRTIVGFGYRWAAPTRIDDVEVAAPAPDAIVATTPAMDAAPSSSSSSSRRSAGIRLASRTHWIAVAAAVVVILAALALVVIRPRYHEPASNASTPDAHAVLAVVPLKIDAGADAAWVRLGGMDLIADRLRRAGLAVQSSEATLGIVMAVGDGNADAASRLRRNAGIGMVVAGDVAQRGGGWTVALQADIPAATALHVEASDADLMLALRSAGDKLLSALGRSAPSDSIGAALAEILQRARAALLADDAVHARAILDQAAQPLREDPELRLLLAQVDARLGHFESADAALTRLLGEVDANEEAYLRMRVLIARGASRIPLDHAEAAKSDFDAALAVPGSAAFTHALGDAYNGRGATGTMRNDYAAAASDLGRARILLDQSGDALAVARVDLELALLDYTRGASAQAAARFEQAARRFETFGALRPLKSALIGLEDIQFDQLQISAALATSDRAWATLAAGGDPLLRRVMTVQRVKILIASGRLRDAHAALTDIEHGDLDYLAESRDDERLRLIRTELALREGRAEDAAREAAGLPVALLPSDADDVLRAKGALWRQRALPDAELAATPMTLSTHTDAGSRQAAPYRVLAEAERLYRHGMVAPADRAFQHALELADANATPIAIAQVIESWVPALLAWGRPNDAAGLGGRIAAWASEDFRVPDETPPDDVPFGDPKEQ